MEAILTAKIGDIKKCCFLFVFPIYKMGLITAEGYTNAKVHTIKVTTVLWVSMKDIGNGLGVTNISDLVLKEMNSRYEKKN